MGKTQIDLDEDMVVIIACTVAKISAQLKIKPDSQTPRKYALEIS